MAYQNGNYQFVVHNNWTPLTMQEVLTPFTMYKEAYDKDEERYLDLVNKTDPFSYLEDTLPEGSKARQIYEGYANDLRKYGEDFGRNGLSMSNKRGLLSMRRRYQGEIGRLDKADTNRKLDIEEQRKLSLQDPTRLYSYDAQLSNLDDYLDGSRKPYKQYSGAMLAQQVGTAASALAKGIATARDTGQLDKYTKLWVTKHGLDEKDVMQAVLNPNNLDNNPIYKALIESTINSSGIPKWSNAAEVMPQALNYAVQGLWQGVGQTAIQTYEDYGTRLAAKEESEKRLASYKHELDLDTLEKQQQYAGNGGGNGDAGTIPINEDHLVSPNMEGQKASKEVANALQTLGFNKDGTKWANEITVTSSRYLPINSMPGAVPTTKSAKVRIFGNRGAVYTKYQFIAHNKNKGLTPDELAHVYDYQISPAITKIVGGPSSKDGKQWTMSYIGKISKHAVDESGANTLGVLALPIDSKEAIENIVTRTQNNDDELVGIKEVKSWNNKGDIKLDSKPVKKDDFIDNKGNLTGKPLFYNVLGTNANKYIILKNNGKTYAVPREKLGSLGTETLSTDVNGNPLGNTSTYNYLMAHKDEIVSMFMKQGFSYAQSISKFNTAVSNAGAGAQRDAAAALNLKYNQKPYDMNSTNANAIP